MTHFKDYVVPDTEVLELSVSEQVLCTSDPDDGMIEGIDYENW